MSIPEAKPRLIALLRWSEQYTKTDMVYLMRGSFWSTIAQIAASGSVFIFALIVGRFLPKEVYGQYKYILAAVTLLGTFSLNNLSSSVFQSVSAGYDGSLHEGFWANLRWSFLVFAGAFALAVYYYVLGNPTLAIGILVGGCLSPVLVSANMSGSFLTAKKDFARAAIYFGIIETFLSVGALIITILLTKNPLILAIVYFVSNTLATLWLYHRVVTLYEPDIHKTDPEMLRYGKHLSLMGVLNGVAGNIDEILAFHYMGAAQLAMYSFAVAIPDQTKGPLKTIGTMIQTNFVSRTNQEISTSMRNKMLWFLIVSIAFTIIYIICAPFIYAFLFPNYAEAAWYSQIYAISTIAFVFSPSNSYLAAKKRIREQYISNIFNALFQIAAMVTGILWGGLLGLILARVAVRFMGGITSQLLYTYSLHNS